MYNSSREIGSPSDPVRPALTEAVVDTTIVIPVYFNEKTIQTVVENNLAAWTASGRAADELEFVLVDDGSQDGSWGALQALRTRYGGRVTILRLAKNHGSQLAILAGASLARGQKIAMVTADGQEPADLVARMAAAADAGSRLVLAVRAVAGRTRLPLAPGRAFSTA